MTVKFLWNIKDSIAPEIYKILDEEINKKILDYPGVKIVNADPYGAGWIAKLKVNNFPAQEFKTGREGVEGYRKLLEKEGIECKRHV